MSHCRKKRPSGTGAVPVAIASRGTGGEIMPVRARFDRVLVLFFGKRAFGEGSSSRHDNLAG